MSKLKNLSIGPLQITDGEGKLTEVGFDALVASILATGGASLLALMREARFWS